MRLIFLKLFICFVHSGLAQSEYLIEIYQLKEFKIPFDGEMSGQFFVTEQDLADTPLIKDSEILGYDTLTFTISFSESAAEKIAKFSPALAIGVQFVLTVNKVPILTGYIFNAFSSFSCSTYHIFNLKQLSQKIFKGYPERIYHSRIQEFRKLPYFVLALIATDRIIK